MAGTYDFLLDTYETEILKTTGIWAAFAAHALEYSPHRRSRTVLEQMEHQIQSEGRWMREILGVDTGDFNPPERTQQALIAKYATDARRRLEILRRQDDEWWRGEVMFFDVPRSRAWVMTRRLNHSTHHRGQLVVYLRLAGGLVPSVYGPTADTAGKVLYRFPAAA